MQGTITDNTTGITTVVRSTNLAFPLPSFGTWKLAFEPPLRTKVEAEFLQEPPQEKLVPVVKHLPVISDYLSDLLDIARLPQTVDTCAKAVAKYKFDAIAYRGMSGALIAIPLALKMNKALIMVRKPGDGSHSYLKVEGAVRAARYIIADDFVSTGLTAHHIIRGIEERGGGKCIGILEAREATRERIVESPRLYKLTPVPELSKWVKEQLETT